jgi:hypothetical protein
MSSEPESNQPTQPTQSTQSTQPTIQNQPTIVELEDLEEASDDGLLDNNSWDIQPLRPPPSTSNTVKLSYGVLVLFVVFCVGGIILLAYSTMFSEQKPKEQKPARVFAKLIQDWPPTVCHANQCRMNITT